MRDIEAASRQRVKRNNIFVRIFEAIHTSRRLEAQRVLRRYDHLIERHQSIAAVSIVPDASHTEESHRNAHGNKSSIRANDGIHGNATGHSAQDQFA
jgi:hypothetical protein